ncbi:unnamed protein product, partial [Staurois parvus]
CTLPRKKKLSSNIHQTEHVPLFYQEIFRRHWKKGRIREDRIKHHFYTLSGGLTLRFHYEYNKHALLPGAD